MNMHPQPRGVASILRAEIEAWRRAGNASREAVAIEVMTAHQVLGGEAATGVDFTFAGDAYTQAKKAAQKLFRWLDGGCPLPADIVPSILAALPLDVKLHCLNQMYRPIGVETRCMAPVSPARFDGTTHLQAMIKEGGEAKTAVLIATTKPTTDSLRVAIKELNESIQADENAKRDAEAALLKAEQDEAAVSK